MCMYVCEKETEFGVWQCECSDHGDQKRALDSPGSGVRGGCDLAVVKAEDWTQVLCSSIRCSCLWSHLSSPVNCFFLKQTKNTVWILKILQFNKKSRTVLTLAAHVLKLAPVQGWYENLIILCKNIYKGREKVQIKN